MSRARDYVALVLLGIGVGCANLTPEMKFEQSIRSYETALTGAYEYYDPDKDGTTDRAVSSVELRVISSIVVSGRGIRDSGIDAVIQCKAETEITGKKCSSWIIIMESADALNSIASSLAGIYGGSL